jgi:hypothetical protein
MMMLNENKLAKIGFYSTMFALFSVAVYNDQMIFSNNLFELKAGLSIHTSFGKRLKFLTYIDLVITFFFAQFF